MANGNRIQADAVGVTCDIATIAQYHDVFVVVFATNGAGTELELLVKFLDEQRRIEVCDLCPVLYRVRRNGGTYISPDVSEVQPVGKARPTSHLES